VEAFGYLKGPADMIQYYEGKYKSAAEGFSINKWEEEEEMNSHKVHLGFKQNNKE
jgi:hypothetical protein